MEQNDIRYQTYLQILKEELVPAMGCTEPIAISYGAAKAKELLGTIPDKVVVEASANIIKNVKSVVVPNTNGLKGIEAAAVDAGILGYHMYKEGQQFRGGDGIIAKGVENTITNVSHLGKAGMKETDKEIINIMLNKC